MCGNSWTPGGVFEYYRKVEGVRQSRLGGMRNPVYFNYGIAVHGAYEVPDHPASHGCIRIDNSFSEHFQSIVNIGEQVFVWDGIEEPETYGAQSGLWDWADPNYTHDDVDHDHHDAPADDRGPDDHGRRRRRRRRRPPRRPRRRRSRSRRPRPRRPARLIRAGRRSERVVDRARQCAASGAPAQLPGRELLQHRRHVEAADVLNGVS